MQITVIIPHLNQEDHLVEGLRALSGQRGHRADVDVIVVDNGSVTVPDHVVAEWPGVRLVRESTPGPGPARNRGVREATGEVLAFIDADCRAAPGWLAAIETAFQEPATEVIGGDVRLDYRDPTRPSFIEPYEALYSYRNREHVAEGFSGTGNLAVRADVMATVGPFGGIEIAEDRDWGIRANAAGFSIRYCPDMIVYHPARTGFAELQQKWDRHIVHDFEHYANGRFGLARWLVRAVAVAGSPIVELKTVLTSKRLESMQERWLAWACLILIRLYRGFMMVKIAVKADPRSATRFWNRP